MIFSRKKKPEQDIIIEDLSGRKSGKKGRPTPRRRDVERQNRRPLVPDDRKEAKERARAERARMMQKQREALEGRGNPAHLPPRDQGPIKAYIRDYVDARWSISEFLLPLMLLSMIPAFFVDPSSPWAYVPIYLIYGFMLITAVEIILVWRKIRAAIIAKYGVEETRGHKIYLLGRMLFIRRFRSPVPMINRGEHPELR